MRKSYQHFLVGTIAFIVGFVTSPIPKKLGFYRWLTTKDSSLIGLTPAHFYGLSWTYTFEDFEQDCESLKGQNALVTGANSGIGEATKCTFCFLKSQINMYTQTLLLGFSIAKQVSKCGVNIVMVCRNERRCSEAAQAIEQIKSLETTVEIGIMDTSSLSSVRDFSLNFLATHGNKPLDMLFLNAGRGVTYGEQTENSKPILSEDGIEIIFATNYIGHHLLWNYLKDLVMNAETGRVVLTSSAASFQTFPFKVPTTLLEMNGQDVPQTNVHYYGSSKLAQIMFAKKVTRYLGADSNVFINSAHPGAVQTEIWKKLNLPKILDFFLEKWLGNIFWTSDEGALTLLYLAANVEELRKKDIRGKYFHPQSVEVVNPFSLDESLQDRLWQFSEELISEFI